jgi:hypothetical protein
MEFYSIKVHQSPSKFLTKVFDAGLHGQKTLSKFLMENFDRVNRALYILSSILVKQTPN